MYTITNAAIIYVKVGDEYCPQSVSRADNVSTAPNMHNNGKLYAFDAAEFALINFESVVDHRINVFAAVTDQKVLVQYYSAA